MRSSVLLLLLVTTARGEPPAVTYDVGAAPAVTYELNGPWEPVQVSPPATPDRPKTKRVRFAGYWWDELPGGRLRWCLECNGPYPAGGVPGVTVVDWNGGRPGGAQGVAPPPTFRSGPGYDPDHACNRCGGAQYVISGRGPRPGTHTHTCSRCGHSWWH